MTTIAQLLTISLLVAVIARTVTAEEIFSEPRAWLERHSKLNSHPIAVRKLAYLPTCHYCFSHYVAAAALLTFQVGILWPGWRGYLASFFVVVATANLLISYYERLRVHIAKDRLLMRGMLQEIKHAHISFAHVHGDKPNGRPQSTPSEILN
jgi:hypothetical protein